MDGVLIVRKEKGYTSHDVVAKLRGILHMKKIGHTGTLDPEAEGVLPVVLGKATRLVELLTEKEKTYEAVLRLGIETDTQDMTGTILNEKEVSVSEDDLTKVIYSWRTATDSAYVFCLESKRQKIIRTCQRRQNCRTQTTNCEFL